MCICIYIYIFTYIYIYTAYRYPTPIHQSRATSRISQAPRPEPSSRGSNAVSFGAFHSHGGTQKWLVHNCFIMV